VRRFELSSAAILVWLCSAGCVQRPQTIQSQRNINWMKADPSANTAAEDARDPVILPETYLAAAQLFEKQGNLSAAIIQYQKAVSVNHSFVDAYNRLGILLGRLGRHPESEDALKRAVELAPERAFLRNNLGYEYALQNRWAEAERQFREALRLAPGLARAQINLGLTLAQQERYEEALTAFDAVLPEADAFYNLGLMFRGQHRYRDAADAFERVLVLNPDFVAARKQLEEIKPKLALSTTLEPVANLKSWSSVAPLAVDALRSPAESGNDAAVVPFDPEDIASGAASVGPPSEPDDSADEIEPEMIAPDDAANLPDDEP
jgi:tetratricopeptide (TPR) repeat protein